MHRFDTPAPITAVLDIPAGRVQIIAADRADSAVEVRPANPDKSRDVQAAEQTAVEYGDGVLRITGTAPRNQLFGPSGSVEVTVQLPAGSQVEAKSASGEFRGVGRLAPPPGSPPRWTPAPPSAGSATRSRTPAASPTSRSTPPPATATSSPAASEEHRP